MHKSQPDGTRPLPETAEVGGEGGSFGESASRESRQTGGHLPRVEDEPDTDATGNATRMTDLEPDGTGPEGIVKHPTEP